MFRARIRLVCRRAWSRYESRFAFCLATRETHHKPVLGPDFMLCFFYMETSMERLQLHLGDCLDVMKAMPDNSVDLVLTDPPYFKVKDEPWDNQWAKPNQFLAWLDQVLAELQRVLKPNGSLYLFASPQMAARVEVLMGQRFEVLNSIRWHKASGWHKKARKEDLRSYLEPWEAILFAEHYGADESAKGSTGYELACDALWCELSTPLRSWFIEAWDCSGLTRNQVDAACNTKNVSQYWFSERNYQIPTSDKYAVLQGLAPGAFARPYEHLRAEYDSVHRNFETRRAPLEALRRPFAVTADVPHTDLWAFDPVKAYAGKHPCEKPAAMLEHIITASSRPGAVVLDAFMGTGSAGIAAMKLGRKFVGIEMAEHHFRDAQARILDAIPSAANDNAATVSQAAAG